MLVLPPTVATLEIPVLAPPDTLLRQQRRVLPPFSRDGNFSDFPLSFNHDSTSFLVESLWHHITHVTIQYGICLLVGSGPTFEGAHYVALADA